VERDEELCAFFVEWQKASYRLKRTKLMQILKETGINWRERRLISKLYMDQVVKIQIDQMQARFVNIRKGVRQGCCLPRIMLNALATKLADFKMRGHAIPTVKYADTPVILTKEGKVLQGIDDRVIQIVRRYKIQVNE
jgi:hypothetical protein